MKPFTIDEMINKAVGILKYKIPNFENYNFSVEYQRINDIIVGGFSAEIGEHLIEIPFIIKDVKLLPIDMMKVDGKWVLLRKANIDKYFEKELGELTKDPRNKKKDYRINDPYGVLNRGNSSGMRNPPPPGIIKQSSDETIPEYYVVEKVGALDVRYWDDKRLGETFTLAMPHTLPERYKQASLGGIIPFGLMDVIKSQLSNNDFAFDRIAPAKIRIVRVVQKAPAANPINRDLDFATLIADKITSDKYKYSVKVQYIPEDTNNLLTDEFLILVDVSNKYLYPGMCMPSKIYLVNRDYKIEIVDKKYLEAIWINMKIASDHITFNTTLSIVDRDKSFYIVEPKQNSMIGPFKIKYNILSSNNAPHIKMLNYKIIAEDMLGKEWTIYKGATKEITIDHSSSEIALPTYYDIYYPSDAKNAKLITIYDGTSPVEYAYNFMVKFGPEENYIIRYENKEIVGYGTRNFVLDLLKLGFSKDDILYIATKIYGPDKHIADEVLLEVESKTQQPEHNTILDAQPNYGNLIESFMEKESSLLTLSDDQYSEFKKVAHELEIMNEMFKLAGIPFDDNIVSELTTVKRDTNPNDLKEALDLVSNQIGDYLFTIRMEEGVDPSVISKMENLMMLMEDFKNTVLNPNLDNTGVGIHE